MKTNKNQILKDEILKKVLNQFNGCDVSIKGNCKSERYLVSIKTDEKSLKLLNDFKRSIRGVSFSYRGRSHNRKQVYNNIGKLYVKDSQNDIPVKYSEYFSIYLRIN